MRRLHAVGLRERFVGRGLYRPLDTALTAQEEWTLHRMDDAYFLRVDRTDADGFTLYEALLESDGMAARFNEERFDKRGRVARATRIFVDGTMQVSRTVQASEVVSDDVPLPMGALPTDWPLVLLGLTSHFALQVDLHPSVYDVASGQVVSVVAVNRVTCSHNQSETLLRVVQVQGQRLWLDSIGILHRIENDAGSGFYLDSSCAKSGIYAPVQ